MAYTLGEAAKACGRSKATISKAIKNGKISAAKEPNGRFSIDPAELHRVYPINVEETQERTPEATAVNTPLNPDYRVLQAKLEAAEMRLSDREAVIDDLREERDRWRRQATALLEDKRPKGFFRRLFSD